MPSVTRKNRSNRAQRRESVQRELLGAVDRLLDNGESYTELSVERLVAEAGISRSTFYVYFEDKGDLLSSLAEDVIVAIGEAGRRWWDLPPNATKEDIREALREVFRTYRDHRAVFGAVVDTAAYDAGIRQQFGSLVLGLISELAAHIRTGQQEGYVKQGLDPDRTAAWLTWMAERGLNQLVAAASEEENEMLLTTLTEIVWNTLYEGTR
jgi:TetR/AcrR family transcriptional regulator, ethionamide resistance regulator